MPDQNSDLERRQRLDFSGEQGFFDKSKIISYSIFIFLGVSLFAFLHFREVRVEVLELNSIASRYIVSQVAFDFLDDEATLILKQDAVRNVGKIYQLPEWEARQKRTEFDDFLLYNQGWREQSEDGTFDELYRGSELMEKVLLRLRLTDAHTFKKIEEVGLPTSDYQIYTVPLLIKQPTTLPGSVWQFIQSKEFPKAEYSALSSDIIIEFFRASHWQLEEDIPAERQLRKKIQSIVPEKYTHVNAGKRIIDQGERVTARHIAMLQAMKTELNESRNLYHPLTLLGTLIKTILILAVGYAYLKITHSQILSSNRKLFLLFTIIVMTLGISKLVEFLLLNSHSNLIEIFRYPLFAPLAAILIASLINPAVASFVSAVLVIILSVSLAFDQEGFLLMNLLVSFAAIVSIYSLRRRKEIFVVCLKAWVVSIALIFALHVYDNQLWQMSIFTDILSAGVFLLLTGVVIVGLLPLLESGFKILTDATLMEYMDPNNDLLRRLTMEAPGTYQHSVVVGNLAETAALAINANGLFCRAAALYHDVGKMSTAQYFTENQIGEMNIHQLLTPEESAHVIMAHVPEGVLLAREAGLPEPIIDIIKEHHGTTLVYYFYCKQVEKMGGKKELVDEKEFRYIGPKPKSKESGIIMIADSFEAASRSLDRVNESTLTELVDRLVRDKFQDGQFSECQLTCENLAIVKKILVKTLMAAGHSRIKYPTQDKKIHPLFGEESA